LKEFKVIDFTGVQYEGNRERPGQRDDCGSAAEKSAAAPIHSGDQSPPGKR
jgi:hypothetical protein